MRVDESDILYQKTRKSYLTERSPGVQNRSNVLSPAATASYSLIDVIVEHGEHKRTIGRSVTTMAAFNRPTEATYEIHDEISVETSGKHNMKGRRSTSNLIRSIVHVHAHAVLYASSANMATHTTAPPPPF
jgi:hypothetical protein